MASLPRALTPHLNAPGLMATAGAVYAGAVMIYDTTHHHGAWSTPVFVSLVAAIASLLTRFVVTPTGDPRDGNGNPLVPAPAAPVITVNAANPAGVSEDLAGYIEAAVKAYAQKGGSSAGLRTVSGLPSPPPSVTTEAPPPPAAS